MLYALEYKYAVPIILLYRVLLLYTYYCTLYNNLILLVRGWPRDVRDHQEVGG